MSDRAPSLWPITVIEHPRCARCNTRMNLSSREPSRDGAEKRIFECHRCNFMIAKTVPDPLRSPALYAMTRSLRPPA
ncbi:MAG: hypothetical protein JWP85_2729 [Rhodoglobus sp.]|nr:hypothetical protein [Rhodoglobus sp.]